jgi:hypothetical protein
VNEINVATNNFSEGIFRALVGVAREQLQIGFAHVHKDVEAEGEIRQGNVLPLTRKR